MQKLTEVGVDRHRGPFAAAVRLCAGPTSRASTPLERLRRVAREAAMQSRRAWLPVVEGPVDFSDAAARPGRGGDGRHRRRPAVARTSDRVGGPRGRLGPEELGAGLPTVAWAPMRTETTAVAAGTLLVALRSGLLSHG